MIDIDIPKQVIWLLRWLLFLGPLAAVMLLGSRQSHRARVGGLFAFLYGLGTIFGTHMLAMYLGAWRYGGEAVMLNGMPADILIGGALLFGPALFFAFPKTKVMYLVLPVIIGGHATVFRSLEPLVEAGPGWFLAVLFIFAVAHIPSLHLARWTAEDVNLPLRAALLAFGYGFIAFLLLPSVIMAAMGGAWRFDTLPPVAVVICVALLGCLMVIGLSAVQNFAIHGEGTPIPLDPTKRLVRSGIYAYLTNPMQACTAASWIVIGALIGNPWVALAAAMAVVFVLGIVRWHHRIDLEKRFPEGWAEYRDNVPEWLPRWRPWVVTDATLHYDPQSPWQSHFARIVAHHSERLILAPSSGPMVYGDTGERHHFSDIAAMGKALERTCFPAALLGAAILLVALPVAWMRETLGAMR